MDSNKATLIKTLYLYLVSFVALMMLVFSTADMINIVLRTFIFTKADQNIYYYPEVACVPPTTASGTPSMTKDYCPDPEEQRKRDEMSRASQRQRDLVRDISFIVVALPLFAYHWRIIRRKE